MTAAILLNSSVDKRAEEKGLFPVIFAIVPSYPFLWAPIVPQEEK